MLWLGETECHRVARVGGKAANLSKLASRFRVPPGFCVTAEELDGLSDTAVSLPEGIQRELAGAYEALGQRCGQASPGVAVRSSAIDEDGASASFAGQLETFLNIVSPEAVAEAVMRCYRSAFSARAMSYRHSKGSGKSAAGVAVLVQWLVPAQVSGVAFSNNPVTSDADEVLINGAWGLGESIVSGLVTPDSFAVRRADMALTDRTLGDKDTMTIAVPGGTRQSPVPSDMRGRLCLNDALATEVARLAVRLESVMGWPVDIEWALHGGDLYLLQCRPITARA